MTSKVLAWFTARARIFFIIGPHSH